MGRNRWAETHMNGNTQPETHMGRNETGQKQEGSSSYGQNRWAETDIARNTQAETHMGETCFHIGRTHWQKRTWAETGGVIVIWAKTDMQKQTLAETHMGRNAQVLKQYSITSSIPWELSKTTSDFVPPKVNF